MAQHDDKAVVVICLGINPYSSEKTLQGLMVCSGILDYFRAINGRGYIMTVNFSGTRLLQAKTPEQAAACLREDCLDWSSVLDRAVARLRRDAPAAACRHVEVVLVGTDDVPSRVRDPASACARLRGNGVRVNSILIESPGDDGDDDDSSGRGRGSSIPKAGGWKILDGSPTTDRSDSWYEPEEVSWGMVRLARETGGLSLLPNTEGKLAMHQLFSEMFRRWGEGYWKSASAGQKQR